MFAAQSRRLHSPVEGTYATVSAALPRTHLWVRKAGAIAASQVGRLNLDRPKYGRVDEFCHASLLVCDALEGHLTYRVNRNRGIVAALDRDLRLLSRKPFGDEASENLRWAALLTGENGLELLNLPRISCIVDQDPDRSVAAEKILRKIDEPDHDTPREVHALRVSLLDCKGESARTPPLIWLSRAEGARTCRLAAAGLDELSAHMPRHVYFLHVGQLRTELLGLESGQNSR